MSGVSGRRGRDSNCTMLVKNPGWATVCLQRRLRQAMGSGLIPARGFPIILQTHPVKANPFLFYNPLHEAV